MSLQGTDLRARLERTFSMAGVRRVERDENIGDPQQRKRDNDPNGRRGNANAAAETDADIVDVSGSYHEARMVGKPVFTQAVVAAAVRPAPPSGSERHLDIKV